VVDMQRIFAELPGWRVDTLPRIVPAVKRLALRHPERTVFTRFLTAKSAGKAKGAWQHYYLHWSTATRERLAPGMLDLIEPLAAVAHGSEVCNKTTYSPFENGSFGRALRRRDTDTLVVAGVETDVCVLATVLGAVDRGLRVVIATDAVTSGCLPGHDCVLQVMLPRHDRQVELATTRQILAAWRD
jgi:nicotinamidase-related amidase